MAEAFAALQTIVTALQFVIPRKPDSSWFMIDALTRAALLFVWIGPAEWGARSMNSTSSNKRVTAALGTSFTVWATGQLIGFSPNGHRFHEILAVATLVLVLNWLRNDLSIRRSWSNPLDSLRDQGRHAGDSAKGSAERSAEATSRAAQDAKEKADSLASEAYQKAEKAGNVVYEKGQQAYNRVAEAVPHAR